MHGSVCCIIQKFVEETHGRTAWNSILQQANMPGLTFSPMSSYDDDAVVAILMAGAELLGCEMTALLRSCGEFAGPELIRFAGAMLHPKWTTFEILLNIESLIHRTVRMRNPDARPANVSSFRIDNDTVEMVYSSHRGLCALAHGIVVGMAGYFNEEIEVTHPTCCHRGDAFCTFQICRINQIAYVERSPERGHLPSTVGHFAQTIGTESGSNVNSTHPDEKTMPLVIPANTIIKTESPQSQGSSKRESPADCPPPAKIGRYEVIKVLGSGGMGIVYQAIDPVLGRLVAVKTLLPEISDEKARHMFLEEARAMSRVSHENVIRIYDTGTNRSLPFLVMEYFEGLTLADRMRRNRLPFATAKEWFLKIAEGIDALHNIGLVHRDVKPSNIMVSADGRKCCMLDFGLARESTRKTEMSRTVCGSAGYVAPERLCGQPADYRSDYFSLGCVGLEMFCGSKAFPVAETDSILVSMKDFQPDSVDWKQIPDSIRELLQGLLQYNKEERLCDLQTIRQLLSETSQSREGHGIFVMPEGLESILEAIGIPSEEQTSVADAVCDADVGLQNSQIPPGEMEK